ncbi:hypothetical protein Aperf_G00000053274 [Anoplocephala perfoliata]
MSGDRWLQKRVDAFAVTTLHNLLLFNPLRTGHLRSTAVCSEEINANIATRLNIYNARTGAIAPILGYWDIRGHAEVCRLLLRYCGVKFEDKRYVNPSDWFSTKLNLGLDFPNLLYYIDGDYKLSQSAAILEYIADSHDMIPTCKKSRAVLHMINDDINDFRNSFGQIVYNPDFIRYPDFNLCEFLNVLVKLDPAWLDGHSNLKAYLHLFEVTLLMWFSKICPALKGYMSSKKFKTCACSGKRIQWAGDN